MILNANICLNIWNEKKEKNITEFLLIEWIAMTKSYYRKMFKPEFTTLEAFHRLELSEAQKEVARRLKAVQKENEIGDR